MFMIRRNDKKKEDILYIYIIKLNFLVVYTRNGDVNLYPYIPTFGNPDTIGDEIKHLKLPNFNLHKMGVESVSYFKMECFKNVLKVTIYLNIKTGRNKGMNVTPLK